MQRAAILLLLLASLSGLARPLAAQTTGPPRDKITDQVLSPKAFIDHIRNRLIAIQKLHREGKKETAFRALELLDAEVDAQEQYLDGHVSFWWPDLIIGRLKFRDRAFDDAETAVAPIVSALDNDRYRQGATRMEAMLILTKALTHQKKYEAADTIGRALLRDAPDSLKPKWHLEAESYIALAATWAGAADATELRAALLDRYLERETATVKNYLRFWRIDLDRRRTLDRHADDLVRDARYVYDFIRTDPEAAKLDLTPLKGGLGRIFAENKDYKRAEPIFREQLEALEPGSEKYYWAWQNLIATHSNQKRYTLVLSEAAPVLAELEPRGPDFARVTSFLLRTVAETAKKAGDDALFHDAMQRSYIAMRQIVSANHKDALRIRQGLDLSRIDPDTFPFSEELGLTGSIDALQLTLDGTVVLDAFFAGRYVPLGRRLKALARDPDDAVLAQLNLGLYHALLGEIGPAETALAAARDAARASISSQVPANSPLFDLYLVMTHLWARDWKPARARDPVARLLARSDLTAGQQRTLDVLRLSMAATEEDYAAGRQIYLTRLADFDPREDDSAWGVLRAITMIGPLSEFAPRDADAFAVKAAETLHMAGNPRLATTLLAVSLSNSKATELAAERKFQSLAFHLQALSRMLPPDHQWQAVARLNFAFGLADRGRYEEALALVVQTTRAYRKSPWHRADVLAYLDLQQALLHSQMGNFDLAFAMLSQTWKITDAATFRASYWREILTNYAFGLVRAGRPEEALAVTQSAVNDTAHLNAMAPSDRALLLVVHGQILSSNGKLEEARIWMDQARDAIPSAEYRAGLPLEVVLTELAALHYDRNDYSQAYAAIRQANDLHFTRIEQARTDAGSEIARNPAQDRNLIINEAVYGWLLTRALREGGDP